MMEFQAQAWLFKGQITKPHMKKHDVHVPDGWIRQKHIENHHQLMIA